MIKKIISGIFVSLLGFIGFSNATFQLFEVGLNSFASNWNLNYDINFIPKGRYISNYFGSSKNIIALSGQYLIFWNDGGLYFFNPSRPSNYNTFNQGYFQYVKTCNQISSDMTGDNLQTCFDLQHINTGSELVSNFLKTIKAGDFVFIEDSGGSNSCGGYCSYRYRSINLCFSSSEFGKSLCFVGGSRNITMDGYSEPYPFLNSLQLGSDITFSNINRGLLDEPPGFVPGGVLEGSNESNINNSITGDYVYSDCTRNDILIALESEGYNKYVCYGGIDNFQLYDPELSYNPIAGTGLSISQIWANSSARAWDNFPDWFTFWEGLYLDSSDNNYNAMWSSYPAVYHTYFQMYNSYGGGLDPRTLLEYCQLRTLTGDSLNNSAGGYFKPVCETVIREKQTGLRDCRVNGTLYSGCEQNPQVAIGTNWNGVGNMSGVSVKSNSITFIQNYFNLLKSKLQTNGFVDNFSGIIPGYIIVFLLGIILFRFMSH